MRKRVVAAGAALLSGSIILIGGSAAHAAPAQSPPAGDYIVVLHDGASQDQALSAARVPASAVHHRYRDAINGYSAVLTSAQAAALENDPNVETVQPNRAFHATAAATPIEQIPQIVTRAGRRIDVQNSSTHSGDGKGQVAGVNIAVLDSGIQPDQPDLRVVGGTNCSTGTGFRDREGHGTIVAGVAAARDNAFGIVGVAPGARLWSVRVLDQNLEASEADVLCGVDWVTHTRKDSDPYNDITVANMSLGDKGSDDGHCGAVNHDPLHKAICRAVNAGATIVAGAGNDAAKLSGVIPAAYSEVLTATGIADSDGAPGGVGPADPCGTGDVDDTFADFSNFSASPSELAHVVSAPAVCVSSTYTGSDVATDSGTSFASPAVSGLVALCVASHNCAGLTPRQIVTKVVRDAASYSAKHPAYGFRGDPQHPVAGRYYGNLIRASLY